MLRTKYAAKNTNLASSIYLKMTVKETHSLQSFLDPQMHLPLRLAHRRGICFCLKFLLWWGVLLSSKGI